MLKVIHVLTKRDMHISDMLIKEFKVRMVIEDSRQIHNRNCLYLNNMFKILT